MNYEGWKKAFDSDPAGREKSGVRQYRIMRAIDDPSYVMIELEFDTVNQAEALLASMRAVWVNVEGKIMINPQVKIVELVESVKY
jgi:ribosomal protein L35AE/L33A